MITLLLRLLSCKFVHCMSGKKKKHILSLDNEIPFDLIGIVCNHSDYRLVWGINSELGFHLEKSTTEFEVYDKKTLKSVGHPIYKYNDEENGADYHLLKNKVSASVLIPEKPMIDYFLFINTDYDDDLEQLIDRLKKVDSVLGAYVFDPYEIDTCEMFDF